MKPSLLTSTQEQEPNASNVFRKCKRRRLRNVCTVNFGGWRFLLERYWPFRLQEALQDVVQAVLLYDWGLCYKTKQTPVSSNSSEAIKRIRDCYREGGAGLICCSWDGPFLFCQSLHSVENCLFLSAVGWCLSMCSLGVGGVHLNSRVDWKRFVMRVKWAI